MLGLLKTSTKSALLSEKIHAEITEFLYEAFTAEDSPVSNLDRWTQRRVTEENLAKVSLVLEADDPVEYCYQNLIREIDTEAESGIFLVSPSSSITPLRRLEKESGISGKLRFLMSTIAPKFFADELEHSNSALDIVWVSVQARFDRALVEAMVSEIIMGHLLESNDGAEDMSYALRSLLYAFHEDLVRRQCNMPLVLNDRATRDLITMISELAERCGDYRQRVEAIGTRAGTI